MATTYSVPQELQMVRRCCQIKVAHPCDELRIHLHQLPHLDSQHVFLQFSWRETRFVLTHTLIKPHTRIST